MRHRGNCGILKACLSVMDRCADIYKEQISMTRYLYLAALVLSLAGAGMGQADNSKPKYEVYAIRYATLLDFPVEALVKGADPSRKIDLAMTVWLVRGAGSNILVDSGFDHERFFKGWKLKGFVKPSEAVTDAGVK